jgi:hypothetical protein
VDLSNIVISDGPDIPQTVTDLKSLFEGEGAEDVCKDPIAAAALCDILAIECAKGLAERVLATERAAYPAIIREEEEDAIHTCNFRVGSERLGWLSRQ